MLPPPALWEIRSFPQVRIPGWDGSALVLTADLEVEGAANGLQGLGVRISLVTPSTEQVFRRLPVSADFATRLAGFLHRAAAHLGEASSVEPFRDAQSGLTLTLETSDDFGATLKVAIRQIDEEGTARLLEHLVPTSRACLVTAAHEASALADGAPDDVFHDRVNVGLPLDLLDIPALRLTGIYETGVHLSGKDDLLLVCHFIRLNEEAQGDVETALLAGHLPFCAIAIHGVFDNRDPWTLITQILPTDATNNIAAPWDPISMARHELHAALAHAAVSDIYGEAVATRPTLVEWLTQAGVPEGLIDDWDFHELVRASIADVANIPITELAIGRLTGCAFPDTIHDCPKEVFRCAYSHWQEQRFNQHDDVN